VKLELVTLEAENHSAKKLQFSARLPQRVYHFREVPLTLAHIWRALSQSPAIILLAILKMTPDQIEKTGIGECRAKKRAAEEVKYPSSRALFFPTEPCSLCQTKESPATASVQPACRSRKQ